MRPVSLTQRRRRETGTFKTSHPIIALTSFQHRTYTGRMEVHFKPETESRLRELASKSGRPVGDLAEDAMAAYLAEVDQVREMLDNRYDGVKSGRVKPLDGEQAFAKLRQKSKGRRARS